MYTMSHKNEILDIFVKSRSRMELQIGEKIMILKCDNERQYKSDSFLQLCLDEGIERHFTVRDSATE